MSWMNFNDAEEQNSSDLIPHKTPVKVHMKIRAGGHNDPAQGWTGGIAKLHDSGAVSLDCEFTIIGGKYNKRKVWTLVGLHSPKGPKWAGMGRSFIRAALESARGIAPNDNSERAQSARQIRELAELDGLEFCAFVEVQKPSKEQLDQGYSDDRNAIQTVIPCTHREYKALMSGEGSTVADAPTYAPVQQAASSKPAWAQ